jgi:hypothetical protein
MLYSSIVAKEKISTSNVCSVKYPWPVTRLSAVRCFVTFAISDSVVLFAAISSGVGATNGMDFKLAARTLVLNMLYKVYPITEP